MPKEAGGETGIVYRGYGQIADRLGVAVSTAHELARGRAFRRTLRGVHVTAAEADLCEYERGLTRVVEPEKKAGERGRIRPSGVPKTAACGRGRPESALTHSHTSA